MNNYERIPQIKQTFLFVETQWLQWYTSNKNVSRRLLFMNQPLAYRMRPTHIDNIVGQQHLVGKGKIIRRMVEAKMLSSMILYGPPGIGKTSIASAIAGTTKFAFRVLNAASDTKKIYKLLWKKLK